LGKRKGSAGIGPMTVNGQLSTAETVARALWLTETRLLDVRAWDGDAERRRVTLRMRMLDLGLRDEQTSRRAVERLLVKDQDPRLADVLNQLCSRLFELRWGLPTLRQDAIARRLARVIDTDALVCLHPALALPEEERFDWAAVPMAGDDGAGLLREGSVDTHIHLGGALAPVFYWLALMGGELPLEVLRSFPSIHRGHAEATFWQDAVARAMWTRLSLAKDLQQLGCPAGSGRAFPHLPDAESAPWTPFADEPPVGLRAIADTVLALGADVRHAARLDRDALPFFDPLRSPAAGARRGHYAEGERRLLANLGGWLRRGGAETRFENRLLAYLRTRNAFHQAMCHDSGADGLLRFGETFGRRGFHFGTLGPRRRQGKRRGRYQRLLRRLERTRMATALDAQLVKAFGARTLEGVPQVPRGIEMRVSVPFGPSFLLTLRAWLDGLGDHLRADGDDRPRGSQVGLLFHFIKTGKGEKNVREAQDAARRLGSVLASYPTLRRFVVGVDAAGDERRAPPRTFARAFAHLHRLQAGHRPCPDDPAMVLDWTYHVGEDVDDLLSGLRHIEEVAAHLLDHGTGRLGHGLALAMDAQRFYQDRGGEVEVPRGAHLLDLVWTWGRLVHSGDEPRALWAENLVANQLQGAPRALPRIAACYRAMDLERVPGGAAEGMPRDDRVPCTEDALLRVLGFAGDADAPVTLTIDARWIDLVSTLQSMVRDRLARLRVTVEVNPTSNLVIGGYRDYADLPYPAMVASGLPVSINTDDPGLFVTCLPNEFASLYRALVGPMTHRDAAQWLEARRLDAVRSSFLGPQVPAGREAWRLVCEQRGALFEYRPAPITLPWGIDAGPTCDDAPPRNDTD
jgi:adenosine deaminase